MATTQAALTQPLRDQALLADAKPHRRVDAFFLLGVAIALGAALVGIRATGVSLGYFLQPTGAVIVLGGTLGVILVTTPRSSLLHAFQRLRELVSAQEINREELIDEIIHYARITRRGGLLAVDSLIPQVKHPFLADALQLAMDVSNRGELQALLETELRMRERQGESDAKVLETAGGFAPTIGIIGTVVGLIDVMRQFSNLQSVGFGIGTAFVSTIYGLALANLLLLPAAHRIRARVAENFEIQELIIEGVLSIVDTVHPALIRTRLSSFIRGPKEQYGVAPGSETHAA